MPTELPTPKHHLKRKDGCYYCGGRAVNRDHIPPDVFFPSEPEVRRNLITVPSCKEHNQGFSQVDAIVAGIVGLVREASTLGMHHFETGSLRDFDKDHQLPKRMLRSITVYQDPRSGLEIPTFEIDIDAFKTVMERIAKGLHFYDWRERWPGALAIECEQLRNADMTVPFQPMYLRLKQLFFAEPERGENPRVFHYQWHDGHIDGNGRNLRIVAMRFYDGLGVYAWGPPP